MLGPYETLAASGGFNVYVAAPATTAVPLTGGLDLVPSSASPNSPSGWVRPDQPMWSWCRPCRTRADPPAGP